MFSILVLIGIRIRIRIKTQSLTIITYLLNNFFIRSILIDVDQNLWILQKYNIEQAGTELRQAQHSLSLVRLSC